MNVIECLSALSDRCAFQTRYFLNTFIYGLKIHFFLLLCPQQVTLGFASCNFLQPILSLIMDKELYTTQAGGTSLHTQLRGQCSQLSVLIRKENTAVKRMALHNVTIRRKSET